MGCGIVRAIQRSPRCARVAAKRGFRRDAMQLGFVSAILERLGKVIHAAALLGIGVVNTFIGRDWHTSIDDNWPLVREIWPGLVKKAGTAGVKLAIEHCPMLFSKDEWPGGKNLAISPA